MEAHGIYRRGQSMLSHRSHAELYIMLVGVALTVIGAVGFAVNADFATGSAATTDRLLFFDVNGWHNLVHLASGLVALGLVNTGRATARNALIYGAAYAVVTVWGMVDSPILNMIPIGDNESVLHGAIAAIGLAIGLGVMPGGDDS